MIPLGDVESDLVVWNAFLGERPNQMSGDGAAKRPVGLLGQVASEVVQLSIRHIQILLKVRLGRVSHWLERIAQFLLGWVVAATLPE